MAGGPLPVRPRRTVSGAPRPLVDTVGWHRRYCPRPECPYAATGQRTRTTLDAIREHQVYVHQGGLPAPHPKE